MEIDPPRESSKHTKLLLYILIGIACVAVAVFGLAWVMNRSTPEKRAQAMFEKLGGMRYTLAIDGTADAEILPTIAGILRTRFGDLGAEHVGVEIHGNEIVVSVPESAALTDTRVLTGAGNLAFHMAHPDYQRYAGSGETPVVPDAEMYPYRNDPSNQMLVWKDPEIDGSQVQRVYASKQLSNWEIMLQLKSLGATQFYDLSKLHTVRGGTGLPFAMILDGEILSAPVFNEPIAGGRAVITGDFSEQEARSISSSMMTPMPVGLKILDTDQTPAKR